MLIYTICSGIMKHIWVHYRVPSRRVVMRHSVVEGVPNHHVSQSHLGFHAPIIDTIGSTFKQLGGYM